MPRPLPWTPALLLGTLLGPVLGVVAPVQGQEFDAAWSEPAADRWNYGFNATPGTRNVASVFGYTGDLYEFDERDGQVIIVFDTADQIDSAAGADRYRIDSVEVTVTIADELAGGYDPTQDDWRTYLEPSDPDHVPDGDPGRPIELFPTGFRNGVTAADWTETTDFSLVGPFGFGVRTAYAADLGRKGVLLDVSNSITDRRTPESLAVGVVDGATGGGNLPEGSVLRFTFDGSDDRVAAWLGTGLDAGRLHFSLSSLIEAQQEGGDFVDLYMRENPLVTVGVRSAATLRIVGGIEAGCNGPGDLDNDCTVGGGDIGILLSLWGTDDPDADLNGDGTVDGADFGILLTLF